MGMFDGLFNGLSGGGSPGGAIDWSQLRDMMAHRGAFAPGGGPLPTSTLSGGPSNGFQYTPGPRPNVPFSTPPRIGPQLIPRGGNLGLPSNAPQMPVAVDPSSGFGGGPPPVATTPPVFGSSYQTPMAINVANAAQAPRFDQNKFNMGLGLMQRGGSQLGSIAQYLPSIFGLGK